MIAFLSTPVVCPAGLRFARRSSLPVILALLLALPPGVPLAAQLRPPAPPKLAVTVVEGENGVNLTQKKTDRMAVVRVQDEKGQPVQDAAVIFTLPDSGAGGAFGNNRTLLVRTNHEGLAVARNFRANDIQGKFQVRVRVSYREATAITTFAQTNALQSQHARRGFFSAGRTVLLAAAGAAAIVAVVLISGRGDSGGSDITISPGTGTIGGPK